MVSVIVLMVLAIAFPLVRGAPKKHGHHPPAHPCTLVWADEFDGPNNSPPDPTKWTYDVGGGGWGNHELENYTNSTQNARVYKGSLVIEAQDSGGQYTSARLLTQGLASFTYGHIEARIKLPRGQGMWPAFWMLGTNIDQVGWPACGEIDIMEYIGKNPTTAYFHIHGPVAGENDYGPGAGAHAAKNAPLASAYHIFAVNWSKNLLIFQLDGKTVYTARPKSIPQGGLWVFNHPFFILLNLAIGGNWPGSPDATTVFPQQMLVDYVRVYRCPKG